MYQFQLTIQNEPQFRIGDRLYIIQPTNRPNSNRVFSESCPVCHDKKEITVNGYVIPCGYCTGTKIKNRTTLTLHNWIVAEYIVNKFVIMGHERKNAYGQAVTKENNLPQIKEIHAFHKEGNERFLTENKRVDILSYFDDSKTTEWLDRYRRDEYIYSEPCFKDKRKAERLLKAIKKIDAQRLEKFNKENGSSHEYPW